MKPVLVITVRIEEHQVELARKFSQDCVDTNTAVYAKRGQFNRDKIIMDIFTGKMGELAVYEFLHEHGFNITFPDFEIYTGRRKSWAPDLTVVDIDRTLHIHCKTQTEDSKAKYGLSWILQYSGTGKGHQDRLFKDPSDNDFIALSVLRHENMGYYVDIYAVLPFLELVAKEKIELPVLKHLQNSKRAIYYDSIIKEAPADLFSVLSLIKPEE